MLYKPCNPHYTPPTHMPYELYNTHKTHTQHPSHTPHFPQCAPRVRGSLGAALELQSSDSDDSHAPAATPEGDEEGPRAGAGVDADHSGEGDPQGGGGGSGGSQAASDASADDDADEDQHGDDDANDDANDDNSGDAGPSQPPLDAAQEASEVQALLEEESVVLLAAEELARLSEVDCLTGVPRAGDILLHALPVCAPYAVLANYKHKVRLCKGACTDKYERPSVLFSFFTCFSFVACVPFLPSP